MATITVTTLLDTVANDGELSLREALQAANTDTSVDGSVAGAGTDRIVFAPGLQGTLTLLSGQLAITDNLIIDGDTNGDGTPDIAVSGNNTGRVFLVSDGGTTSISATLNGLDIRDGLASTADGGAIFVANADVLVLSNGSVSDSSSTRTFSTGGDGGGIYGAPGSNITLINATLSENHAGNRGGGVHGTRDSVITLVNSSVWRNDAEFGAGGVFGGADAEINLVNTTVSGNRVNIGNDVTGGGGGITGFDDTTIVLVNSTVTGNSTTAHGGGIRNFGAGGIIVLSNSIVAGNAAAGVGDDLAGGPESSSFWSQLVFDGGNVIGSTPARFASASGPRTQIDGTSQAALETVFARVAADPFTNVLSGVLADNGGPVKTVAIAVNGIAHDDGAGNSLPFDVHDLDGDGNRTERVPVDARRVDRTVGTIDIGAIELQSNDPPPVFEDVLADGTQTVSLNEGAANGTLVLNVNANDGDGGAADAGITYALVGGNIDVDGDGNRPFAITASTGAIRVNDRQDLDFEDTPSFELTVQARDGTGIDDASVATVIVELNDREDLFRVTTLVDEDYDGGSLADERNDGGGLSLREALALSNDAAGSDEIVLRPDLNGTISLAFGELVISDGVAISGDVDDDGDTDITIDAHDASRIFVVAGGTSTLDHLNLIRGSTADFDGGGAIVVGGGTDLTMINTTVASSNAPNGGGILNHGTLTLISSTISGNTASYDGGGIRNDGTLTLTNSTLANNSSSGYGGGLYNWNTVTFNNSTVTGNSATYGGGIFTSSVFVASSLTFNNSIVAGNSANFGRDIEIDVGSYEGVAVSFGGPNVFSQGGVGRSGIDIIEGNLANIFAAVDPVNGGGLLADNGGPVHTVAIASGGVAEHGGYSTTLPDDTKDLDGDGITNEPLPFDARGFARVFGADVDIGAFELQNIPPTEAANTGLTVDEGDSATILGTQLDYDDPEQGDGDITYTITAAPANGELFLDGNPDPLGVGDTFTQADIANGDLSYTHDGGEAATDSFAFDVSDGQGGTTSGTFALTINPLNDTAGGAAGGTIQYIEDQTATALDPSLTVTDPDDTHLEGARVAITGNFAAGQDVLAFTPQSGIVAAYNAATGVLTLTGTATLAQYQDALRSVTYFNSSQNPSDAARSVAFEIDDGGGLVSMGTVGVNVIPQLDPPGDINGDHTTDIVWRENTGRVALWEMAGVNVLANTFVADIPNYWHIVDANGDFDGDGNSDILWQDDVGVLVLWTMDGPNIVSNTAVAGPLPDYWHIEDTGDFTGDGRADILWRDDAGRVVLWEMDGATVVSNTLVADVATTSRIEDSGDFTGDGMNDILWRDDDGTLRIWEMDGATEVSDTTVGTVADTRHLAGSGDFNGDGRFDLLWRDDDGTVTLWEMDGAAIIGDTALGTLPSYWQVADIGDYTGDQRADILWRDDAGTIVLWEMNGPTIVDNTAVNTIPMHWNVVG